MEQPFRALAAMAPEERTALRLTEQLLLHCHQHESAARSEAGLVPPGWEAAVGDQVLGDTIAWFVDAGKPEYLSSEDVAVLDVLVARTRDEVDGPRCNLATLLAMHAIATVFDTHLGSMWQVEWRAELIIDVLPGRPHPVFQHDPRPWLDKEPSNSKLKNLAGVPLSAVSSMRIGSEVMGRLQVTINYDLWNHGAPLANRSLVLGAAQPNMGLGDFDIVEAGPDDEAQPRQLHNRGVVGPELQVKRLVGCVKAAAEAEVSVLVIPEYCLPEGLRSEFMRAVNELPDGPTLIVGGSSEVDVGAEGPANEAWILLKGPVSALMTDAAAAPTPPVGYAEETQRKMEPAVLSGVPEGISYARELHVFPTGAFTFAVLICKDATSSDAHAVLAELGVNLVLVPSFSEKSGSIHAQAASLAASSQAFVVVAVGPAVWDKVGAPPLERRPESGQQRDEASFACPYEHAPFQVVLPQGLAPDHEPPSGPGVWAFKVDTREAEYYEAIIDND